MIVLSDSNEQLPLEFDHPYITEVRKIKLKTADYQALYTNGEISSYVVERKSISDLFGTLTGGMVRFKKEIQRSIEDKQIFVLAIEGTFQDILSGHNYSAKKGNQIIKTIFTLWRKYGVHFVFCSSRTEMAEFITHLFLWCGQNKLYQLQGSSLLPPISDPSGFGAGAKIKGEQVK